MISLNTARIGWMPKRGPTTKRKTLGVLFRVASDVLENVGIVLNDEIKTPVTGDAGLPAVLSFVGFLGK